MHEPQRRLARPERERRLGARCEQRDCAGQVGGGAGARRLVLGDALEEAELRAVGPGGGDAHLDDARELGRGREAGERRGEGGLVRGDAEREERVGEGEVDLLERVLGDDADDALDVVVVCGQAKREA